jgi:rRNA maturation protein Nop10
VIFGERCPDCDRDGEVSHPDRGWIKCPRCGGTRKIEEQQMNEEVLYRWLMISAAVIAVLCGLGSVGLVILCAVSFSMGVLLCSLLLAGGAIGCGYFTVYFSQKTTVPKVFNNADEREVLNNKQRRELKKARGEVVMEKAMIEVEHERENIVHNLQLTAADPDKPPHETRWSSLSDKVKQIRGPQIYVEEDE